MIPSRGDIHVEGSSAADRYTIIAPIGKGGMGEVYRARDNRLQRDVALKILPVSVANDPGRLRRLEQEAHAAGQINHPNVVAVYDVASVGGQTCVVQELLEGETLGQRQARGRIPEAQVIRYAIQIAEGLAAAHRRGIIHRDLKPDNIFITTDDDRAKILDFGLAKSIEPPGPDDRTVPHATLPGAVLGTVGYMAPEQVRGAPADQRADIFSFGVVLFEMLSGRRAFARDSAAETMAAILNDEPPELRSPNIPGALAEVVRRCLAKNPDARYQSARDLAFQLEQLSSGVTSASLSAARPRARVWPVAVAALLIAAAVTAFVLTRPPATAPPPAIDSVAVLPFQDLSRDSEAYLADGMTEALIATLAQVKALKVISRTSVIQYRKTDKTLPQIGKELGVAAVIEGSILRSGERIRVTAQLIDARSDTHLWARTYDRDLRDVLQLQDEIARAIVEEVRVELLPAERKRLSIARRQVDPAAHDLYIRGRYEWNKRGPALNRSIDLLRQAIAIEPAWPLAHAALADAYNLAANNRVIEYEDGYRKGIASAREALELDGDLGQAHVALAFATWQLERNWGEAEKGFRRGIDLQPSYASAHHFYALFLVAQGRDAEGLREIRKALELDPLSPRINTNYGDILRTAGHEAEAIEQYEKWFDADPRQAVRGLVFAHVHRNEPGKALAAAARAGAIPDFPSASHLHALATASATKRDALPLIRRLEAQSDPGQALITLAAAYVVAGDDESAWRTLRRAVPVVPPNQMFLREPIFERIRKDARYQEILRGLNLQSP